MSVKKTKMIPYTVEWLCDKCGAVMKYSGQSYMTYPAQHEHVCNKCGYEVLLPEIYPHIEHKSAPEPECDVDELSNRFARDTEKFNTLIEEV